MSKAKPSTKEQLVYFLHNHVSLGTYDKKFIDNLITMYVASLRPVTSNQSNLLDKITLRYERQLRKEEIDANEMVNLSWKIEPVESSPKYTEAYVDLHHEVIEVRSPFKNEFIKEFKSLPTAEWDKDNKVWSIPLHEKSLRQVLTLVEKHYQSTNYSDEVKSILNTIDYYKDARIWNPTLVSSNGFLYIAASNRFIDSALANVTLTATPACIAKLIYHGIEISKDVLSTLALTEADYKFLVDREPTIEMNPQQILEKLKMLGVDYVLLRERSSVNKTAAEELIHVLEAANIHVDSLDHKNKPSFDRIKQASMPVLIGGYSFATPLNTMFAKVIGLVNNNPIKIK
jgi:hypothetical protein